MHWSDGFSSLRTAHRLLVNSLALPFSTPSTPNLVPVWATIATYLLVLAGIECAPFERSRNRKGQVFTHTRLEHEAVASKVRSGLNVIRIFYTREENDLRS